MSDQTDRKWKFCPWCGGVLSTKFLEGRDRLYCGEEDRCLYENPLPATTSIVIDEGKILLVLRNREPGLGQWALPGGFIETGESPVEAAARELKEETGIRAYDPELIDTIHQESAFYQTTILIIGYRFDRFEGNITAGDDAGDARFFPIDEMPSIAFESHVSMIRKALAGGSNTP
ncbi:MAG: NUDIX domain-containing protein [Candidatus Krumholzibacteria bacterium]|nr:NUDIX domain-containing protein [Candidatus Krumholzibacteria bacterium]